MLFDDKTLEQWIRPEMLNFKAYQSAREQLVDEEVIFLDANENPLYDESLSRYPDPIQRELRLAIANRQGVAMENVLMTNGSDEAVDLLIRATCTAGVNSIAVLPPTYGMYEVAANLNGVEVMKVPLDEQFQPDMDALFSSVDQDCRLLFLCSPNNPTGNLMDPGKVQEIICRFQGFVVIDEAYLEFTKENSWANKLLDYENLVVLRTFSKAWGMAGVRLGYLFANEILITVLQKMKPPYNVSEFAQRAGQRALFEVDELMLKVSIIVRERQRLASTLKRFPVVQKVYGSEANFLLVKVSDADLVWRCLLENGVLVRNRNTEPGCEDCLRISVGTKTQNNQLIQILKQLKP